MIFSATGTFADRFLSPQEINEALRGNAIPKDAANLPVDHPDYPVVSALKSLDPSWQSNARKVIDTLEPVLLQTKYKGVAVREDANSSRLLVGTVGSLSLWRELIYLRLGQAYYQLGNQERALEYLKGIPDNSAFGVLARLESGWTYLRGQKVEEALKELATAETIMGDSRAGSFSGDLKAELQIEKAFCSLEKGDFDEAVRLAETSGGGKLRPEMNALRTKILAQGELNRYLKGSKDIGFAEKRATVEKILRYVDAVPVSARDPEFSFLAGETYWHLASLLRLEEPQKYRADVKASLKKANEWLTPWIAKSLQEKKPLLSEDAFFLSVAVLWEQEHKDEAIPRLQAMPQFFPLGEFRQDTYQLLADYYYDVGDYKHAQQYYSELSRIGSPDKAAYGIYKAAWTFYNEEKKWKALRHFERLTIYYKDQFSSNAAAGDGLLAKEAQQDMLVVMAELMPYRAATAELDVFDYTKEQKVQVEEKIAKVYKEIGHFEDSASMWQTLLAQGGQSKQSYEWLKQLFRTLLAAERRDLLGPTLDRFAANLPPAETPEDRKEAADFEKNVANVLLTINREAKKTDDAEIWKATDALYKSFGTHFPNSLEGDVWYFGAQRKEDLGDRFGAIDWYKKAAETPGFANAADGGQSVLKLAKDIGEDKALKKDAAFYQKLAKYPSWYIQKFPKTPQRRGAEFLYIDYLSKGGQSDLAKAFLTETLKADGQSPSKDHQEQYFSYNKTLYASQKWEEAYDLASATIDALKDAGPRAEGDGFYANLRKFKQETAFQAAFKYDKSISESAALRKAETKVAGDDPVKARLWYDRAIKENANALISLKAWHNLLISFKPKSEAAELVQKYEEFDSKYRPSRESSKESQALYSSIYSYVSGAYDALEKPLQRADTLAKAANTEADPAVSSGYRWDAIVIFGSYYDTPSLKREVAVLRNDHSKILADPKNAASLARLLFWNGEQSQAWELIKPLVSSANPPASSLTLLVDLFYASKRSQPALFAEVKDFVFKRKGVLESFPLVQAFAGEVFFDPVKLGQLSNWQDQSRLPASAPPSGNAQADLKARVDAVASVLKGLEANKTEINPYATSPVIQAYSAASCAYPQIDDEAARRLDILKSPPIASKQWPDFLKRIEEKSRAIRDESATQKAVCDKQKRNLAFLKPSAPTNSPFCDHLACFPDHPEKVSAVFDVESGWKKEIKSRLERLIGYLQIGAWAPAEVLAFSSPSQKERTLLLGWLRVALGDTWNGAALLKEIKQDPEYGKHARFLLARIAWRHGYRQIASEEVGKTRADDLNDYEKALLDEMQL
jgi:hypothetical protein